MLKNKTKILHLIYGCILSALLIALGIALIASCLDIYHSGKKPYTPESIASHFQQISLLVYVTFAFILGGIILNLILPEETKRTKAVRDEKESLIRLRNKAGVSNVETKREQNKRLYLKYGTAILCAFLAIHPLVHFMNPNNFIGNKNDCIAKAMIIALSYAAASLALTYVCKILCGKSMNKEMELYKQSIANKTGSPTLMELPDERKEARKIFIIRTVIAVLAIVFIVIGIFNGGAEAVLKKANAICMECIGMG